MKLRNIARKYGAAIGGAGALLVASSSAHAAFVMPAVVTSTFSDLLDAWTTLEGYIWPVLAAVVIGMWLMKMFKKGANKVG